MPPISKANEWNHGVTYTPHEVCPLEKGNISTRLFDASGIPNAGFEQRLTEAQRLIQDNFDFQAKIFITGGHVQQFPKEGYASDVDLFVTSGVLGEQIKATSQTNETVRKITALINHGQVPDHMKRRKSIDDLDLIVSSHLPFEYWPFGKGETRYFYDVRNRKWYSASENKS